MQDIKQYVKADDIDPGLTRWLGDELRVYVSDAVDHAADVRAQLVRAGLSLIRSHDVFLIKDIVLVVLVPGLSCLTRQAELITTCLSNPPHNQPDRLAGVLEDLIARSGARMCAGASLQTLLS